MLLPRKLTKFLETRVRTLRNGKLWFALASPATGTEYGCLVRVLIMKFLCVLHLHVSSCLLDRKFSPQQPVRNYPLQGNSFSFNTTVQNRLNKVFKLKFILSQCNFVYIFTTVSFRFILLLQSHIRLNVPCMVCIKLI
jgi:hypothetical protein